MRVFLAAIVITALVIGSLLSYMGMFSQYEIAQKDMGPYKFVYEKHVGSYSQTGKVMDKIYEDLKSDGIEATKGMGIYFDNPRYTPTEELESEVGSIVEVKDYAILAKVSEKYNIKDIPVMESAVVEFPLKNMLSYMLGPMKIYPMFEEYMKDNDYQYQKESYEIYDVPNKTIIFAQELVPLTVINQ